MRSDGFNDVGAEDRDIDARKSQPSADPGATPCPPPCPSQIGGYRIVRWLASGASAVVYEAEQPSPRRRVALKVLRRAVATRRARRLFELEAELLGRLHHPGIAAIHAAGVHDDGEHVLPLLAMELVLDAQPITTFARSHGLDRDARIALLANVCDAVGHGHQRGIVHCDLKPANILVDADGRPKVIDFGVARIDGGERGDDGRAPSFTGTVQCMSPEQCSADGPVDARSDVYALGMILHELVAHHPPYDLRGLTPAAARLAVLTAPAKPLRTVDRTVTHDLEGIVLKALSPDPSGRYRSASALGDDLRRYLAGEPVLARPLAPWATLVRLALRHRAAAVAAAGIVAALIATTATAAVLLRTTRDALGDAQAAENRSLELARALWTSVHDAHMSTLADDPLADDGVRSAQRLARLAADATDADAAEATARYLATVGAVEAAWQDHESRLDDRLAAARSHLESGRFALAETALLEVGRFRNVDATRRRMYEQWIASSMIRPSRIEAREVADEAVAAFPRNPAIAACAAEARLLFIDMARVEPGVVAGADLVNASADVAIERPFAIATTKVTQGQFVALLGWNPARIAGALDQPLTRVSWFDAISFCNALSEHEGRAPRYEIVVHARSPQGSIMDADVRRLDGDGYRLPREAEWVRAATGGAVAPLPTMLEDDSEWCEDAWPANARDGTDAVIRGGEAERKGLPRPDGIRKGARYFDITFRVVRDLEGP